jgi:hypothetical protein
MKRRWPCTSCVRTQVRTQHYRTTHVFTHMHTIRMLKPHLIHRGCTPPLSTCPAISVSGIISVRMRTDTGEVAATGLSIAKEKTVGAALEIATRLRRPTAPPHASKVASDREAHVHCGLSVCSISIASRELVQHGLLRHGVSHHAALALLNHSALLVDNNASTAKYIATHGAHCTCYTGVHVCNKQQGQGARQPRVPAPQAPAIHQESIHHACTLSVWVITWA